MTTRLTGRQRGRPPYPLLTPAEERVLKFIREGKTNAQIGARLGVTPDAVKYHVSNMLGKLQLENREQLAAWRETSGLKRACAGASGLGWKLAIGAGAVAAAAVAAAIVWGPTSDKSDEASRFDPDALASGVLTVGINGQPADGNSTAPSISADGRFIAFESDATNLVPNDTNGVRDIFLIDRLTNETRRIAMGMGGSEPNGPSFRPSISADGKWVAFDSQASNLVKDDRNGELDRALPLLPEQLREQIDSPGSGARVLQARAGSWAGSDVFVVSLGKGSIELVSVASDGERANLGSFAPSMSREGRYVAFESMAPNLKGRAIASSGPPVGHGDLLGEDVYFHDRRSHETTWISKAADPNLRNNQFGSALASITRDGKFVVFNSRDGRLVSGDRHGTTFYVWEREEGDLREIPLPPTPAGADGPLFSIGRSQPEISDDGQTVVFAYRGSAPVRPSPTGLEVNAVFYHHRGATTPTMIPGSEGAGGLSEVGLAYDSNNSEVWLPSESSAGTGLASFVLGADKMNRVEMPQGIDRVIGPALSLDGHWITATQIVGPSPSGLPVTQIVVFPR